MVGGWIFATIAGLYAFQVHGVLFGILAFVGMVGCTVLVNMFYMTRWGSRSDERLPDMERLVKNLQRIKWGIFIVIMIVIALTGAEIKSVP